MFSSYDRKNNQLFSVLTQFRWDFTAFAQFNSSFRVIPHQAPEILHYLSVFAVSHTALCAKFLQEGEGYTLRSELMILDASLSSWNRYHRHNTAVFVRLI